MEETEALEQQETLIVDHMAGHLAETFRDVFNILVERRHDAYSAAIAPLDAEIEALEQESAAIEQRAQILEGLLESRARVSQYEADKLTLAGKHREAEAKREEMKAAENAPRLMRRRQREIEDRIRVIESEKEDAETRAFGSFYKETTQIIRVVERGLFIVLLDGTENAILTNTVGVPVSPTLFTNLTAPEHSAEFQSGSKWYGIGLARVRGGRK